MKTCVEIQTLLDDYVDGYLQENESRDVRDHLVSCGDCRREEEELRTLIFLARNLPRGIEPGSDLWPRIRSRIGGRRARVSWGWSGGLSGVLAAAMIALVAGVWLGTMREGLPINAPAPVAETRPLSTEEEYARAKSSLMEALHNREGELPPEVIETVQSNLRIIENAVAEIQVALADSPENPHLERVLIAAYKNEIELLRRAVLLADAS